MKDERLNDERWVNGDEQMMRNDEGLTNGGWWYTASVAVHNMCAVKIQQNVVKIQQKFVKKQLYKCTSNV